MNTEQKERPHDYSFFLDAYEIPYQLLSESYYHVREPHSSQGWILHVTIVISQINMLLKKILPILYSSRCAFKIIRDKHTLMALNAGHEGYNRIGKVICIYPENDQTALLLREELLPLLRGFKGPGVLTDFHLGGVLYTRYGSFSANNLNLENAVISDGNGQPALDKYTIPASIPKGIFPLFQPYLQPPKYLNADKFLYHKYLIKSPIAITIKGNTLFAGMKNGFFLHDCILKQGRDSMIADDAGRDIKDRLKWQLAVHHQLQEYLPIPKAYEYFEVEGDGFLSMEFISGLKLNHFIGKRYRLLLWPYLSIHRKKELLHVMKQVVDIVKKMHGMGYIHRDINSNNFIVKKNKSVRMIDLELAYCFLTHTPAPPFEAITIGYGSAEQMTLMPPTFEDDVYSIGALLILFFTGLEPMLVIEADIPHLEEKLNFLTGNSEITELILQCLDEAPARRPSTDHILSTIIKIESDTSAIKQRSIKMIPKPTYSEIHQTIDEALNGLMDAYILSGVNLWVSGNQGNASGMLHLQVLPGLGRGISGILYLLSRAKMGGHDITPLNDAIQSGWTYCVDTWLPALEGGLYTGKEGVALMMTTAEKSGLIKLSSEQLENITNSFSTDGQNLDIVNGMAGKGIAIIQCKEFIEYNKYVSLLDEHAFKIMHAQEQDGSWISRDDRGSIVKQTGFEYGVAGIIYFLLEYCMESGHDGAWSCITKGLSWLEKKAIKSADRYEWHISDQDEETGGCWSAGAPGIALCFLKAFKITGVTKYKKIAEKALNFYPPAFTLYNLSTSNGMAGLGEIYLEAYDTLQSEIYLERANWIAWILINLKNKSAPDSCYWYAENDFCPAPDLMNGCSGIIHFLLRYNNKSRLSLPLLF
jgi:serine/threonine protein kinase